MKLINLNRLLRSLAVAGLILLMGSSGPLNAQSCNLPSVSSPASYNYAARQVTFSNVSLNGGGNTASVTAGSSVSISFSWTSTQNGSYCPGCIVQQYVGINGYFTQCLTSGFGGYNSSGSQNFTFTAPTSAGIYYITATGTLHFSCQNVSTPICGGSTLAAIRVGNPSQTASVSISGDASFCPGNSATMNASFSGNFCTSSALSYQWYYGGDPYTLGTAISGATSSSHTSTQQGNYRVVVTNACGGSVTSSPFFLSQDNVAPVVKAKDVTLYLDANGSATLTPGMMDDGSTDNCGINTLTLSKTTFGCNSVGQSNNGTLSGNLTCDNEFVAYISTSANSLGTQIGSGNNWAQTYSLTNQTLVAGTDYYLHVKATDVGSIEGLLGTFSVSGSFIFANGQQTMSTNPSYWTAANTFGGTTISPVALGTNGMNPWGTRSGIASGAQWIWRNPTNTSGGETVYFTTKISFNTLVHDVTLTATDYSNNSGFDIGRVTVVDNLAPTVVTQNITVNLGNNGTVSINASQIDNGSSDNCAVESMSLSQTSFNCNHVGANTVTLTVTDVNGNSASNTATVTVVDNTAPTVQTQSQTLYLDANGSVTTTASMVNSGSSDACGIASMGLSKTTFGCADVGVNSVTLTVTDNNGNSSNGSATITIVDNIAPSVQTQNITLYLDANGSASATAGAIDNGSYDNCSIGSLSLSKTSFSCGNIGANTVTLTVTDVNGNSSTGTATVTVVDNSAPTVLTKSASVTLSGATASISASDVNDGSYDNCGIATMSVSPSTFNCGNIGANTVTLTVTDVNGNTSTNTATVTVNGYIPACSLTATPSNNTYTGAGTNQMFIGYGPQSMNLSCNASNGTGFSYSWSGSYLSSSGGSTAVFTPTSEGTYTITCTVTNSNGCETTCSITICALDIRSNNNPNNQKVYLCHVPNGNGNNSQTLSISVNAVPSHLNNHSGDKLGQCNQSCGSFKNEPVGELYEVGEEDHLIIYPNPSSSIFKITMESESDEIINVDLFDATGKLIKKIEGGHSFEEMHLDATGLAPGVYLAVVRQGDFVKSVRLTKTQ